MNHVSLGPTGEQERDAKLEALGWEMCNLRDDTILSFAVRRDYLANPEEDQIRSPFGCLPARVLHVLSCAQRAMLVNMLEKAREYLSVSLPMLLYCIDCFDELMFRSHGPRALDIFAYYAHL